MIKSFTDCCVNLKAGGCQAMSGNCCSCRSLHPLSSMLFAQDIDIQTLSGIPHNRERTTTNGYPSTCDLPGPGDAEHRHGVCCGPSCSCSASRGASLSDAAFSGSLSSPSTCNAS